jgi:hypothetical protein
MDRLYRDEEFESDEERLELLLKAYESEIERQTSHA